MSKPAEGETPLTDALIKHHSQEHLYLASRDAWNNADAVRQAGDLIDHARTLERELHATEERLREAEHSIARVDMINDMIMGEDGAGALLEVLFQCHDAHSFWHPIDDAIAALSRDSGKE